MNPRDFGSQERRARGRRARAHSSLRTSTLAAGRARMHATMFFHHERNGAVDMVHSITRVMRRRTASTGCRAWGRLKAGPGRGIGRVGQPVMCHPATAGSQPALQRLCRPHWAGAVDDDPPAADLSRTHLSASSLSMSGTSVEL